MIRELTDFLLGLSASVSKVQKEYPDDNTLFFSSATIIETKSAPAPDWKPSLRRLFQHSGAIIVTDKRIVLRTNILLFGWLAYAVIVVFLILWFVNSSSNYFLVLPLLFSGIAMIQMFPYNKHIAKDAIDTIDSYVLMGALYDGSRISVSAQDRFLEIYTSRPVPAGILSELVSNRDLPGSD